MATENEKKVRASAENRRNRAEENKTSQTKARAPRSQQPREGKSSTGKSMRTTDHDVIRRWVEERGGRPAAVKATESKDDPGMLRIDFPGYSGENRLDDISWDEFFKKFDEKNLEFLYQDETRDGKPSRFWKFVNRESESPKRGEK
jgi:hypothetical protein